MRYESEKPAVLKRKPLFLTMLAVGFLTANSVPRDPHENDRYMPQAFLDGLHREQMETTPGNSYGFAAAYFLAEQNRNGMNVAPAISELTDPGIRPDIVEEQLTMFLRMTNRGSELSKEEERAVADVARNWPDHFEPYFTGTDVADTRGELINRLLIESPPLRRYLHRETPAQQTVASDRP